MQPFNVVTKIHFLGNFLAAFSRKSNNSIGNGLEIGSVTNGKLYSVQSWLKKCFFFLCTMCRHQPTGQLARDHRLGGGAGWGWGSGLGGQRGITSSLPSICGRSFSIKFWWNSIYGEYLPFLFKNTEQNRVKICHSINQKYFRMEVLLQMKRKEKWSGTVFYRLLDRSIFLTP